MFDSAIGWLTFYWKQFRLFQLFERLFASMGATWGVVEMLAFFGKQDFSNKLQSFWWVFAIGVLLYTLFTSWPKRKFRFRINGRDVHVAIQLGDLLSNESVIVPINNRFIVDPLGNLPIYKSILKALVSKLFNGVAKQLQDQIDGVIKQGGINPKLLISASPDVYKVGSVIPVTVGSKQIYFLANSSLNSSNRSSTTNEDLRNALGELWVYIASSGTKDTLSIPVLGTGMGRLKMSREKVIKEIILSFIASLGYQTHCDELIIVINPVDYYRHNIDLDHLIGFMKSQCEYYELNESTAVPQGQPVDIS
ncbi:macro domain-containing protein [Hymenobacter terrenus]|uniref:macro domain-containing protein n=1 Tax=Hymenobacter terrenus TaxID=1629124 RepID=UPI000619371B|nr:macro domain-containing protein [Hymenobacter terrenus]